MPIVRPEHLEALSELRELVGIAPLSVRLATDEDVARISIEAGMDPPTTPLREPLFIVTIDEGPPYVPPLSGTYQRIAALISGFVMGWAERKRRNMLTH